MQQPLTPFVYRSGGALDFSRRRRDCGARPLREENRHAVLRTRTRPHPLRRGRFRLPPAAHPGRRAQFSPRILADRLTLQPDGTVQEGLPPYLRRPAQRQPRPVQRPAGDRSPLGRLHGRPTRADYQNNIKGWGPALCAKRPDVSMDMVHDFLTSMYTNRADFVFTVSRDFVRSIRTPLLIAPDDVPAHPYKVAMEVASLAPHAEVTIYPWKDSQELWSTPSSSSITSPPSPAP